MFDIILTIIGIAALILLWVILYDSNRFVVRNFSVEDERIRKTCRAVVISDLHNKKFGRNNEKLLEAIRMEKPDFVLIAGDVLTARPGAALEPAVEFLRELKKDYPVYYANGNHEHRLKLYPETYGDMAERFSAALKEIGITPLVNEHVELSEYGISVVGAEIERCFYNRIKVPQMEPEYLKGTLGCPDKEKYTILLAHNPDYFPAYARWGADLTISGHVHGGIARVPLWGKGVISPSLRLFPKYDGGIFKEGERTMLLSRGLGVHTIPIRVFNPGELWVINFESPVHSNNVLP